MSHTHPTQEELNAADGYLSRCKSHLARLQRIRRGFYRRIDYIPSKQAEAIIEAHRALCERESWYRSPKTANSAVIDAIILEWAVLTGVCNAIKGAASLPEQSEAK